MYKDLWDEWHLDPRDYAKKIVAKGMNKPFYRIIASPTKYGITLRFEDDNKNVVALTYPGYYTIYREYKGQMECLYVGKTDMDVYSRVHRWCKAVAGKLRHDESHVGGTLARDNGVKLKDKLFVKFIEMNEVYSIVDDELYLSWPLDEWIAPLLKSKYNTNERYL